MLEKTKNALILDEHEITETISQKDAEISYLTHKVSNLEKQLQECQANCGSAWLWNDSFQKPINPEQYICSAYDGTSSFIWESPGNLRIRYSSRQDYSRSELQLREPGTYKGFDKVGIPRRSQVGHGYEYQIAVTIPMSYDPSVSSKSNEKRNVTQWHQVAGEPPAIALELIKPDGSPWLGKQNIFRIVVKGKVKQTLNVFPGQRYDCKFSIFWNTNASGSTYWEVNGTPLLNLIEDNCYNNDGLSQHMGLYLPGNVDDPVGGLTELIFHYWRWRAI